MVEIYNKFVAEVFDTIQKIHMLCIWCFGEEVAYICCGTCMFHKVGSMVSAMIHVIKHTCVSPYNTCMFHNIYHNKYIIPLMTQLMKHTYGKAYITNETCKLSFIKLTNQTLPIFPSSLDLFLVAHVFKFSPFRFDNNLVYKKFAFVSTFDE